MSLLSWNSSLRSGISAAVATLFLAGNLPAQEQADAEPAPMTIGSTAPALDIEHWVQDGNGKYKPVTDFADGKVYVVEFWATWCGPCIASMPHLAETQQKYADSGVQLISISDEKLSKVQEFLERPFQSKEEDGPKTFGELTSVYCLTADPDRSNHTNYMQAAAQNGIPCCFIVGKSGLIEWIGHPMEMDEPLAAVIDDSWNREEFKSEFESGQKFNRMQMLAGRAMSQGDADKAMKLIDEFIAENPDSPNVAMAKRMKEQVESRAVWMSGDVEKITAMVNQKLEEATGNMGAVYQLAMEMHQSHMQNELPAELLGKVAAAVGKAAEDAPQTAKPVLLQAAAMLQADQKQFDEAIATMETAIESSNDRMAAQLKGLLEQLKEQKELSEKADK